jgi:hypothetical protein
MVHTKAIEQSIVNTAAGVACFFFANKFTQPLKWLCDTETWFWINLLCVENMYGQDAKMGGDNKKITDNKMYNFVF